MKNDPWTCNLCGSKNVDQEFAVMVPVNSEFDSDNEYILSSRYGNDFYWCNDCDTEVNPVRDSENPLT